MVIADSKTGRFEIHTGKCVKEGEHELGLGARVVLNLISHLQGKHNHIYTLLQQLFFLTLFDTLLERGLYAGSTVRATSRGFPDDLKIVNKNKG